MTGSEMLIWLIPAALAIIVLAIVSLESLLLLTLFLTPLSLQLSYLSGEAPFDLSLPTEPIMAFLLLVTIFKLIVTREFSARLLRHPVTILIGLYLVWTAITACFSTLPLISFKTLAYRMWFIAGFYLISGQLFFKEGFKRKFIIAYSLGLAVVVFYFLVRSGQAGFLNQKFAHSACYPFFKDHTSFGAAMAFLLPPLIVMSFQRSKTLLLRILLPLFVLLFVAGFIFSYSRAAWVSLIVAFAAMFVLSLRMPKRVLFLSSAVLLVIIVLSSGWIWEKMDSTTEDSSADLGQHLRSASNISTDQSNLERINRWKCALKMFVAKPVAGWGPGSYQFEYAPFQKAEDRTIISTDFGDAGNSHSEYLGTLSESGLPGALLFVLICIAVISAGIRIWYSGQRTESSYFALAVLTGLFTYMIHGLMNSFLDSDKIASLWWGFIAILVAMDIQTGKKTQYNPDL